jgi:nucleotide-binding universal stress UspA family protein
MPESLPLKLLFPFDGSPSAMRAAELVAGYAGDKAKLALRLLNVQPRADDAGRAALEPALESLARLGFTPQSAVRVGRPAPAILDEVRARGCDAIVMGTRGSGSLQGFAFGSVALRVTQGSQRPVLLVKPEARLPAQLGKKLRVLLAMDGGEPANRAAQWLAAWRAVLGELDVQLVHVQQPLSYLETVLPPHDDVIEQWSTRPAEDAAEAARELFRREGIAHHLHLTVGDPALEIRTLAEHTASELIVLGTRGLGAAHHAFIGSVALKSAALSAVPALLVP